MSGALASPLAMDGASFKSSFIFLNSGWLEREIWVLNENSRGSRLLSVLSVSSSMRPKSGSGTGPVLLALGVVGSSSLTGDLCRTTLRLRLFYWEMTMGLFVLDPGLLGPSMGVR